MKVVIATSSYPLHPDDGAAAAGLFVREFAEAVARRGHHVRVLTQARAGKVEDSPELEVLRYPWRDDRPLSVLRLSKPADLLSMVSVLGAGAAALDRAVRDDRPDLVLALWAVPAGLLASRVCRRHGIPYRVWVLGSDIWSYGRNPLTRWIVRRVLREAECLFADGMDLVEEVETLSGRSCSFLPSSRRLPLGLPRPESLDPGRKNFVFIGRFHENKGIDWLVEAIAGLTPELRAKARFHIFGSGPLEARVRQAARGLEDSVRLPGYADREQAAAFLEHCDALVVPSRIESIPVILSDAARARCPVIATEVGDMKRVLSLYRVGISVKPNPDSIRAGIVAMMDRSREEFARELERMAADFSVDRSAERALS